MKVDASCYCRTFLNWFRKLAEHIHPPAYRSCTLAKQIHKNADTDIKNVGIFLQNTSPRTPINKGEEDAGSEVPEEGLKI